MYTDAQKRSHIFDLQTFLRRIQQSEGNATPLVPDGLFGAQTAAAVREYQQQHCLPVTGIADQRTWNAIYASYAALITADALPMQTAFFPPESDTVLKPGAKSPSVYVLQLMLSEIAPDCRRAAHRRIRQRHAGRCPAGAADLSAAADRPDRPRHMAGAGRTAQCAVPADTPRMENERVKSGD